ncbi:MAG TPA: EamA family transporter [Thalassospira lucentensis]|uniref:EamA family transporter n=1 Tax=Thalassospira lucentensis TaxID=168935 RepID=A0A3D5N7Q1_9PROT|nr:DMT family transporter [Thalassospira lucentensis]HCW67163.1 EamA family transporter [Thalassospira lucentensis]
MLPHETKTRRLELDEYASSRRICGPSVPPHSTSKTRPNGAQMDGKSWLMLIVLSILWGGSFFFTEIALVDLPPFTLVLCRVAIASLILWWVVLLRNVPIPRDPTFWGAIAVMGALNNLVPFSLIVWGQTHIASGLAAILNATTPLFTLLIAHIATDTEKLNLRKAAGVLIGFVGVLVVIGMPEAKTSAATDLLSTLAPCAVLLAAISYGCAGVYGRRFSTTSPILTAAGMTSASSLMLIPLAAVVDTPWHLPVPSPTTIMAVLGIAALSTALAYILYFEILKRAGASNLLLVTFLIPVSAILLGVGFLGETLLMQHILGMGVIGVGLAVIDGRLLSAT